MSAPAGSPLVVFLDVVEGAVHSEQGTARLGTEIARLLARSDGVPRFGALCNFSNAQASADALRVLDAVGLQGRVDTALLVDPASLDAPLHDRGAFIRVAALAAADIKNCALVTSRPPWAVAAASAGMTAILLPPPTSAAADTSLRVLAELAAGEIDEDEGPTFVLRGRIVTMNDNFDVIDDGRLVIDRGLIRDVLRPGEPVPDKFANAPVVDTKGVIYPGLIDLHNHFVYNVLPLWVVPKQFENRSQWPRAREYKQLVSLPMKAALTKSRVSSEAIMRYVEAKALIGASTTGQGILTPVRGGRTLFYGAMRNVEQTKDRRLPNAGTRVPDVSGDEAIEAFRRGLRGPGVYFYHLAEGVDDLAHRHFENLKQNDLIAATLVGVHALALNKQDLETMAAADARIVWSPYSNRLLYKKTLKLQDVKDSGVRFCLGCDWSPSGSKNLLHELKVAQFENDLAGGVFKSRDLVAAVTSRAAEVLNWNEYLGRLAPGMMADLLVLSKGTGDDYDNLIKAREQDVQLVVIHGWARYGRRSLVKKLHPPVNQSRLEPFQLGNHENAFYFQSDASPINDLTYDAAVERLREAMADLPAWAEAAQREGAELAALGLEDQSLSIELDNEFDSADPLLPYADFAGEASEAELMAEVSLPASLPLDEPIVGGDEDWDRLERQPNLSDELKSHLKRSYGAA